MTNLRIALISMTDPSDVGLPHPRAFLRIAGASLAQHQLGLALALKCHRVICIAPEPSPDLLAVQHLAEDSGVQFYVASGPRQIAAQVTASDDLFLITDGLFADPAGAVPLLEAGRSLVLVQPVEGPQASAFERIDLNRAAAGLARIPGSLVERLHEHPADCDAISTLMRIALQSRAAMIEVPAATRSGASWRLVRSEAEAVEVEQEWLREHFGTNGPRTPGRMLARSAALMLGSSLLQRGGASNLVSGVVLILLAMAALLGWFGFVIPGFVCAGSGWVLVEAGRRLRVAERRPLGEMIPAVERADALLWVVDAVLAGLVLAASPPLAGEAVLTWLFAPVIFFLLLTMAPRLLEPRAAAWVADRVLLALVLAIGALFGSVQLLVEAFALALVVWELVLMKRSSV
ncbi:hypothetical protein MTR62_00160 [Novosphingobium sp. 1949]|uniref:Uncharacterized protein n=1 Tax=Novosphingobium organovorum TaxID=2930092 RepID=A0ABT0B8F5_9SPHN|nr:hypothetical protein [Novosphingobium organovorum]MCJ2181128.1 hypothetical protein [Novosphingobium organovorum]